MRKVAAFLLYSVSDKKPFSSGSSLFFSFKSPFPVKVRIFSLQSTEFEKWEFTIILNVYHKVHYCFQRALSLPCQFGPRFRICQLLPEQRSRTPALVASTIRVAQLERPSTRITFSFILRFLYQILIIACTQFVDKHFLGAAFFLIVTQLDDPCHSYLDLCMDHPDTIEIYCSNVEGLW